MKTFQVSTLLVFPLGKVQNLLFSLKYSLDRFYRTLQLCCLLFVEYQPPPFSEKFYLVVIEKDTNQNSVLQMWHLHLRSVQACVGVYDVGYLWNDDTAVDRQLMRGNCEGSLLNGKLILPLMTNFFFRDVNNLEGNYALIYPLGINNVHLHCVLYCLYNAVDICFCLSVSFWDEFNIISVMIDYCYILLSEEPENDHVFQNQLTVHLSQNYGDSSPDTTPGHSPLPRSSSTANLQSASKLILSSKLVYSQRLDLPPGVELIRATPSAHLWK